MAIDKKIRYAIQGGGPNYLGKQKMVTAPKKWKSSPDHETAELAYITKKEKDILLDLNIYGSLKNGKPNRGPSGIMSLQGDMGGWSGGGGGGSSGGGGGQGGGGGPHGGGGGGGQAAQRAAQQAAAQRAMQQQIAQAEAQAAAQRAEANRQQRVADQAAAERERVIAEKAAAQYDPKDTGTWFDTHPATGESVMTPGLKEKFTGMTGIEPLNTYEYRDIGMPGFSEKEIMAGPYSYDSTQQAKARTAADTQTRMSGHMFKQKPTTPGPQNIFETGAVYKTPAYYSDMDLKPGPDMVAGPMGYLQQGYQPPVKPGPDMVAGPMDYLQPGYKPPVTTGAGKVAGPMDYLQPKPPLRTRIQDDRAEDIRKKALGDIALQTDKSLMDVSDPSGQRQGIMSGLADMGTKEGLMSAGKNYAKKAAINYGLQKAGLGFINPLMGLASLFGFKMPKGTGTKTAWAGPSEEDLRGQGQGQAPTNIIEASIQKFSPDQMNMIKQRHSQLQGVLDSGVYQGRQLTAEEIQMLQQKALDIQKLMEQYLVDPTDLARGGIARLYG